MLIGANSFNLVLVDSSKELSFLQAIELSERISVSAVLGWIFAEC